MIQQLNSGIFDHIANAAQCAVAAGPLHKRVSNALRHIATLINRSYDPQVEEIFEELRRLECHPRAIQTDEGLNFSQVHHSHLSRWLEALLLLYGLASYRLASEPDMNFYFDVPKKKIPHKRIRKK